MAEPKHFEPAVRQYFNALVSIARYHTTPLVRQSITNGHYGTINLEEAQKQLLSLRSSYPQLGLDLHLTEGYNPETFTALINQFREIRTANQQLLVDLVKEAVDKNDPGILEHFPATLPSEKKPETVPQAPPPPTGDQSTKRTMGTEQTHTPEARSPESSTRQHQQQLQHQERPIQPPAEEPEHKETKRAEHPEENRPEPQQNLPNQRQQRDSNRPRQNRTNQEPGEQTSQPRASGSLRQEASSRRRRLASLFRSSPASGSGGGLLEALNNYWATKDLLNAGRWLANKMGLNGLGNLLGRLANWLGAPERWLGNLARSALNVGGQLAKTALQAAGRAVLGAIPEIAATIGSWLAGAAAAATAIVTSTTFVVIIGIVAVAGLFVFTWWQVNEMDKAANTECGRPGTVQVLKTQKNGDSAEVGQNIEYSIVAVYNAKCVGSMANIEITDTLPPNTTFVSASGTVNGTFVDPSNNETATYNPATNTVTWKFEKVKIERAIEASLVITPQAGTNDSWVQNQATVTFVPITISAGVPATKDNCNGKWPLKNPIGNFGDPACDFEKDKLYALLQQLDPAEAAYWFNTVVFKETGGTYDPNIWADPVVVGTPDAEGAWGLFQMGRGKNGQYDHGDVNWQLQTSNAVNYNNNLTRKWTYWQAAKERW